MMHRLAVATLAVATLAASAPLAAQTGLQTGAGSWAGMPVPNNNDSPYWDNFSDDSPTASCNVGFILLGTGLAPDCDGPNLLGAGGEYFDNSAVTFNFQAGRYEVQVYNNVAGLQPPSQSLFARNGWQNIALYDDASTLPTGPMFIDMGSDFWLEAKSFRPAGGTVRSDALFGSETESRWALFRDADESILFGGFEDNGSSGSDRDYNDVVFSLRYLGRTEVPEPASMALVLVGVAGLAASRRRRGETA